MTYVSLFIASTVPTAVTIYVWHALTGGEDVGLAVVLLYVFGAAFTPVQIALNIGFYWLLSKVFNVVAVKNWLLIIPIATAIFASNYFAVITGASIINHSVISEQLVMDPVLVDDGFTLDLDSPHLGKYTFTVNVRNETEHSFSSIPLVFSFGSSDLAVLKQSTLIIAGKTIFIEVPIEPGDNFVKGEMTVYSVRRGDADTYPSYLEMGTRRAGDGQKYLMEVSESVVNALEEHISDNKF